MKIIVLIKLFVISICLYSQSPNIQFEYDADGNLISRKIITLGPSYTKKKQTEETVFVEKGSEKKIIIYPNPTNGIFQISVTGLSANETNYVNIYSLNGTLLLKKSIVNELTEIDISMFNEGAYLLDIYLGDKPSRWKVIKK